MLVERITDMFSTVKYPVDLGQLVGNVTAILQEHNYANIPLSNATIRSAVLTSLDILDGGNYDLDELLLEELSNGEYDQYGYFDFDRTEWAYQQNKSFEV